MGKGTGLLLGVLFGWVAGVAFNHGSARLMRTRAMMAQGLDKSLPWVALIIVTAVLLALLIGSNRAFGAGALVGAGLLYTGVALAVQLLSPRTAFDVSKLFQVPGERQYGVVLWDGSMLFLGIVLLVVGIRRWSSIPSATQYPSGPYPGPNAVPTQFGGPPQR